ncbi:3-oxoacyl-ACP reductase [Leucobacter sp. USHLN153]|uniref:3-oxoacyl-ACP reductase n=1 Tax=Leucobacter sp. USHLN153 TaxID=3081268 RepID=UPI0030183F2C
MSTPALPEPSGDAPSEERRLPSSQPILLRALKWGVVATVALIVVFGVIGWLVSGSSGLIGGVLGSAFAGVFLAMTIGSITFANRFIESPSYVAIFFGLVMGSWLVKFIAFIVAALLLRDQPWLNPTILFLGVVSGVIVSLVIDVLVVVKSRLPVVSDPQ